MGASNVARAPPPGRASQAPSLSQHPAMRHNAENPFTDSAATSTDPPQYSRHGHGHGHGTSPAGAAAAGAVAGYGLGHHRQSGDHRRHSPSAGPLNSNHTRHSQPTAAPVGGLASSTVHPPRKSGEYHPHSPNAVGHNTPHSHEHGHVPVTAMAAGAAAGYGAGHHRKSGEHPHSSNLMSNRDSYVDNGHGPNSHEHGPTPASTMAAGAAAGHGASHGASHHRVSGEQPLSSNLTSNRDSYIDNGRGPNSHEQGLVPVSAMAAGVGAGYGAGHHRKSGEHLHSSNLTSNRDSYIDNGRGPSTIPAAALAGHGASHHRRSDDHSHSPNIVSGHEGPFNQSREPNAPVAVGNGAPRGHGAPFHENEPPFSPDTVGHDSHGHGHGMGPTTAMAAGALAGYTAHHRRQSGEQHPPDPPVAGQDMQVRPVSNEYSGSGQPMTAQGRHSRPVSGEHRRNSGPGNQRTSQQGPYPKFGDTTLPDTTQSVSRNGHNYEVHQPVSHQTHAQGMHHGLPAGIAAGMGGETRQRSTERSRQSAELQQTTYPQDVQHGLPSRVSPPTGGYSHGYEHDDLNSLPSAAHRGSNASREAVVGGAALAALQGEEKRRRRQSSGSRSRSRSQSRHRSGGLPTHTDKERPPTPFGLSGIGQPYEDKHVQFLQTDPPSQELQRSLQDREVPFANATSNTEGPSTLPQRNVRGYDTPPEVPSRSPNREKHTSTMVDSSYEPSLDNTTSTNSEESYSFVNDPYKPATPNQANRSSVPPWERHQSRYHGTPPHSAGITPPSVPWDSQDGQQRRHSPRASMDGNGRRSSRSPATGINGQPRRLRFEDLGTQEQTPDPDLTPKQNRGYDTYDPMGWSPGVGKAL